MRTYFVVVNENMLCAVNPAQPTSAQVLSSSVIRGATLGVEIYPIAVGDRNVRRATRRDFETYRLHSEGYERDITHYEFPTN